MTDLLVSVLLLLGSMFILLAAVGILRMPDLYMRIGTTTKASTLGLICILTAVAVDGAEMGIATRAIATVVFVLLTAPVAAHMIGRAAYFTGVGLWDRTIVDEMRGHVHRRSSGSPSTSDEKQDASPLGRQEQHP